MTGIYPYNSMGSSILATISGVQPLAGPTIGFIGFTDDFLGGVCRFICSKESASGEHLVFYRTLLPPVNPQSISSMVLSDGYLSKPYHLELYDPH